MNMGFFNEFKGGDSVLLEGKPTEIIELAGLLARFVKSNEESLSVHALTFVKTHNFVELTVTRKIPKEGTGFWLLCARENLPSINGMLAKLAQIGRGHQYFDLSPKGTQLVVSCGEYGSNFWRYSDEATLHSKAR